MPAPAAPPAPSPAPPPAPVAPDHDQRVADEALRMAFEGVDPMETPPPMTKQVPVREPAPGEEPPPEPKKEEPKVEAPKKETPKEEADPLDLPPEGAVIPKPDSKNLRAQLEVSNTALKKLTAEQTTLQEELTKLRSDHERLTKESFERVADVPEKVNYAEEPSVKKLTDPIMRDLGVVAASLGKEGKALRSNFGVPGGYLNEYVAASLLPDGVAKDEALEKLSERMEADLGERGREKGMDLLGRSLPGYEQATAEIKRLAADSGNRRVRQGLEKYNKSSEEIGKLLDPLGELPAEVLAAKPHTVEAFVSNLITSDPKWLKRSQEVKKEITEIMSGMKPLSPEEKAALEANDTGALSDAEDVRMKKFLSRRDSMAKRLFYQTMLHPMVPALLEELETLRSSRVSEDSEIDALANVPAAPPPPKPAAKSQDRNLKDDLRAVFSGKDIGEPEDY